MRTVICAFLATFWIYSYAQNEISLKLMSFNIQQPYGTDWDNRKDSAIKLINQEQPDIIGSQEAVNFQRDYIIQNCKNFAWYGTGREGGQNGEGCWIFYNKEKFIADTIHSGTVWLSETPDKPSRLGGSYNRIFTFLRLKEVVSGRSFYIFNIHNYLPEEPQLRIIAVKQLMDNISKREYDEPFVLTGDFNSPENDPVTFWLKKGTDNPIPLKDTYREFQPDGEAKTWAELKLDYIYTPISNQYVTSSSWIVVKPSNASDHKPIAAVITIK